MALKVTFFFVPPVIKILMFFVKNLKFELEQWQQACTAFDNGDYDMSIKSFIVSVFSNMTIEKLIDIIKHRI